MSAGTAARTATRRRPTRCAWPATRRTTRRARPRACASTRRSRARRCWPSPPTASSARATSTVPAGGTTIEVPVSADWGPGAYALVTAWRPLDKPADRTPTRAIGLTWLGLEPKLRTLAVQIGTPEKITPRQRIEVPIKVGNLGGEEAFVTLAAVDEGILQLTRFKTPNPADYYFGKRRLGVAMRDDYGRLLETRADDLGRIRVGGDAGDIGGLDIVPTRTVALFSGPVKLDAQGEAKIAIEVPDFIGQLRLMAVAYAKSRVGVGRPAPLRARRGRRRRGPAALPGAQRPRAARPVAAQHRRPGRRLPPRRAGDGFGVARPAGRRDAAAGCRPARAPDLAAGRGQRGGLRQGRRRGLRPRQLRGAPRMGHPGARGADAERRRHGVPARRRVASSRSTATSRQASRPAPRRSACR